VTTSSAPHVTSASGNWFLGGAGQADDPDRTHRTGDDVAALHGTSAVDVWLHDAQRRRAGEENQHAQGGEPGGRVGRQPDTDQPQRVQAAERTGDAGDQKRGRRPATTSG